MSHNESPELAEPRKCTLDLPPFRVGGKVGGIRPAALPEPVCPHSCGNACFDASAPEISPEPSGIISLVGNDLSRSFSRPAGPGPYCNLLKSGLGKIEFAAVCTGEMAGDRRTIPVGNEHPFGTFATLGKAYRVPPFLAGAKLPSMKACAQASLSVALSVKSTDCHILCQIPCSSHALRRRQHVT